MMNANDPTYRVHLDVSREQAHTLSIALQVLSGVTSGHVDTLATLIGYGVIRGADDVRVDQEKEDRIRALTATLAKELGYTQGTRGMSRGQPVLARRSHEMYYTLDNALAVADGHVKADHPDARRGMNGMRFTDDVPPIVSIVQDRLIPKT
jgi:hypothetical protein